MPHKRPFINLTLFNARDEAWPLSLLFDTGNTSPILLSWRTLTNRPHFLPDIKAPARIRGIGGEAGAARTTCQGLRVGSFSVKSPMILLADFPGSMTDAGGIGSGVLRQFVLTLDFPNQRIFLRSAHDRLDPALGKATEANRKTAMPEFD